MREGNGVRAVKGLGGAERLGNGGEDRGRGARDDADLGGERGTAGERDEPTGRCATNNQLASRELLPAAHSAPRRRALIAAHRRGGFAAGSKARSERKW